MSIFVGEVLYAIIKTADNKLELKTFPVSLDWEPSNAQLRQHFNYSVNLSDQYSSDLYFLSPTESYVLERTRDSRRKALAFQQTTDRIQREYEVVAISHRKGGWKTFKWNYNDDISFEIYSNFGYGSCSELISRFYYKGNKLTPYSDYVYYRFVNYNQLIHYTYKYELNYSEWFILMNDTLKFYNAVCHNQENEVFRWIRSHLNQMMSGLNKMMTQPSYYFQRPNNNAICVTGEELEKIKAYKIGGAVEFVENIKNLPHQINPQEYLSTLNQIFSRYVSYATNKIAELKNNIKDLEKEIDIISTTPAISIYDRLYKWHYYKDNWHHNSNRIKMLRYLLTINRKLPNPIPKQAILSSENEISNQLKNRDNICNDLYKKKELLDSINNAIEKINNYNESQSE